MWQLYARCGFCLHWLLQRPRSRNPDLNSCLNLRYQAIVYMNHKFLSIVRHPSESILRLLNENIIGTPGYGMRYQHKGVLDKIGRIADPFFVNLSRNGNLIGTCCFCKRQTQNAGKTNRAFYIRYFSFRDSYRRKYNTSKAPLRNSLLRNEIVAMLQGKDFGIAATEKFYHYAYVDPRNVRSASLCKEFGFETVRNYATIIFSRLNPKIKNGITEVSVDDVGMMRTLLTDFYQTFNMFSFENLLNGRKYYAIRDSENKILAGAQVNPDNWKIHSLPGFSGKAILNFLGYMPVLRKLINKNYRFITLEGIYFASGHEKALEKLFEGLLQRYRVNSAIIVVDADSDLYEKLRALKLGPVDKLNKEVKGDVICKFFNFNGPDKESFMNNPAYVSGTDVT
jgi:hypothetical protein